MKKVFITLGVLILVVITALMVIPTFFKGDILQIIEKQSAKYINAKLKIGDMNLDRKSTRLNSSHRGESRMPSSA